MKAREAYTGAYYVDPELELPDGFWADLITYRSVNRSLIGRRNPKLPTCYPRQSIIWWREFVPDVFLIDYDNRYQVTAKESPRGWEPP